MQVELLTAQERKVLDLIIEGLSNVEIAEQLYISEVSVKTHVNNILNKFNLKSRSQIMAAVIKDLKTQVAMLIDELFKEKNHE